MIIDAHAHLWKKQMGMVNGKPVYHIGGGNKMTSADFAALYGSTEEVTEPSMRDNFFYTEEDDDDEGAEWD
jgi:predicted TIM-barrel fold metal-dependent hydrolase